MRHRCLFHEGHCRQKHNRHGFPIPAAAAREDNDLQEILENNLKKKIRCQSRKVDHKEKRPPPDREGCDKSTVVLPRCPSRCRALTTGWGSSCIPQFPAARLLCQPFSPQLLLQTMWPLPTTPHPSQLQGDFSPKAIPHCPRHQSTQYSPA